MSLLGGSIVATVGGLIDKFIPDKTKAAEAQAELLHMIEKGEIDKAIKQIENNIAEAQHASVFVAGWRPALGWMCVGTLGYAIIFRNFLAWISLNVGWTAPPEIDLEMIIYLLGVMLGVGGGMIAVEKIKTVNKRNAE